MTKPLVTFLSDDIVDSLRSQSKKKGPESKYARKLNAIKRRAGEWGVVYRGYSNAYCHTVRYNLRKRFNESTGYNLEWALIREADKAGRTMWTLVAKAKS